MAVVENRDKTVLLFHLESILTQVNRMAGEHALGTKGKDFEAAFFSARDHCKSIEGIVKGGKQGES